MDHKNKKQNIKPTEKSIRFLEKENKHLVVIIEKILNWELKLQNIRLKEEIKKLKSANEIQKNNKK